MAVFKNALACALATLALSAPSALAAKPKATKDVIAQRLAALDVRSYVQKFGTPEKPGTNLYAEVPMTTLPSPPGTKPPKRMHNVWSVVAVRRSDAAATGDALAMAKDLVSRPERASGTIFVFVDSAEGLDAFAELVWMTGRTVTSVDCRRMGDRADACRESFATWNVPTRR